MDDRFNTIAGWVLFAGIVALGSSIMAHEVFRHEEHEGGGYPIEGVVEPGEEEEAELPIACVLATADPAAGEQVFKKCTACHNAAQGGANALGPNLWGVMGEPVATGHAGFAFSDALKSHGGTWDWETMSEWLSNPKKFAPGTKMTFAGLSNPEDRANVMAFLNSHSDSPLPLPPAPPELCNPAAAAPAAGNEAAPAEGNAAAPADANAVAPTPEAPKNSGEAPAANEAAPAAAE